MCVVAGEAVDIVYIKELQVETVIGIYDWEREIRQKVVLTLEMGTDIAAAARSEDIGNTLDYNAVSKRLLAFVSESEFLLVETLAEEVAKLVLTEFGVRWLRLAVGKPGAVPAAADVGVVIERGERF